MHKLIEEFKPAMVILDPVSNIHSAGTMDESTNLFIRLIDFLRKKRITGFLVNLSSTGSKSLEMTEEGLSSMVDTWLLLRDVEVGGERNRLIYVLKSRGMAHSNQVREFLITSKGVRLIDAYLGAEGVLIGSARLSQESRERAAQMALEEELERKRMALERRRRAIEGQIEGLRSEFKLEEEEFARIAASGLRREQQVEFDRQAMSASRRVVKNRLNGK